MKTQALFATQIAVGEINTKKMREELAQGVLEVAKKDQLGKNWSKENYKGGYTSYASLSDLHHRYPGFMEL